MRARVVVSHLVVALLAFGLGGMVMKGGGGSSSAPAGEPTARLAEVLKIEDPIDRTVSLARFLETADPASAIMLRELLFARDPELYVDAVTETLFASWWARSDPAAAFKNQVSPPWRDRHPWMRAVVSEWVRRDPVAAAEAVKGLPETIGQGRIEGARALMDGWFQNDQFNDPRPLFALLHPLEPKARARAIETLLDSMIESQGIDATEQYVESLKADPVAFGVSVESEIMSRMAVALLNHDVERAVAWAEKHGDEHDNVGVLKHLAYYWARRDGEAAMEWAISLPDTPVRRQLIKNVWRSWGFGDAEGSRQWLYARGPEEPLRQIWQQHLRTLGRNDPAAAMEVALGLSDPEVRETTVVIVARSWLSADPEAAEAWIAKAGLSPEVEERIRKTPERRQRPRSETDEAQAG
ncbi:MAG: hypothetical protein JRF61_09095 [Deltaproteobacteria bacterium]|jgi:hypothetical protein|nr:hypothetical protein [Deltaproteobacteria bacterium]